MKIEEQEVDEYISQEYGRSRRWPMPKYCAFCGTELVVDDDDCDSPGIANYCPKCGLLVNMRVSE